MANYKETTMSGTQWSRCHGISIDNPLGSTPSVNFRETTQVMIDNKVLPLSATNLMMAYDPNAVIDLYDLTTLTKTNSTITMGELYSYLFSAYLTAAAKRDADEAAAAEAANNQ